MFVVIGGEFVGIIYEGDWRFELVVCLLEIMCCDIDCLKFLLVLFLNGDYVFFEEVVILDILFVLV